MTCFHPLKAFQTQPGMAVSFNMRTANDKMLTLPCQQCIGCKLERSRQWAVRCIHEASMHEENCFVTLTYDDENLPPDLSLNKTHYQTFIRELRRQTGRNIRYYHCGEYGEKYLRPHYHALLFGYDPPDKVCVKDKDGIHSYTSDYLDSVWKLGSTEAGDLTFESAGYTARYCQKALNGEKANKIDRDTGLKHYERIHNHTGEIITVQKEYATMSLKPAVGKTWFEKFKSDCYPSDFITYKGKKFRVPKYYDKLYESESPELYSEIHALREAKAAKWENDQTKSRLADREQCTYARMAQSIRPYE